MKTCLVFMSQHNLLRNVAQTLMVNRTLPYLYSTHGKQLCQSHLHAGNIDPTIHLYYSTRSVVVSARAGVESRCSSVYVSTLILTCNSMWLFLRLY